MKNNRIFIMATIALLNAFSFVACKKDRITDDTIVAETDKKASTNYSSTQNLYEEAYNLVDEQIKQEASLNPRSCPNITIMPTGNTFPKTVTLDYGTGCTTRMGAAAAGKITAVLSGTATQTGTTITVTFTNFVYKGYQLSGTYKVQYTSATAFTVQITDGSITNPSSTTYTYSANFVMTQTGGQTTTFQNTGTSAYLDDVYSISGSATLKDGSAKSYSATITTPLIKKMECQWIVSGVVEVKIGVEPVKKIDFGTGTCDNQATLTIGRATTTITLP